VVANHTLTLIAMPQTAQCFSARWQGRPMRMAALRRSSATDVSNADVGMTVTFEPLLRFLMSQLPVEHCYTCSDFFMEHLLGCLSTVPTALCQRPSTWWQQHACRTPTILVPTSVFTAGHRARRFPRYPVPLRRPLFHRAEAGTLRVRQIGCTRSAAGLRCFSHEVMPRLGIMADGMARRSTALHT
jgi:hypothetical protein